MNKKFEYKRSLKLPAALGDWTTLKFTDPAMQNVQITSVGEINFDSVSKADLKLAHMIHYRLAQDIAKQFSKDMTIKIELHSIESMQLSYERFIQTQTADVVQAKLELSPVGFTNIVMDWELADMMVNRLTGGEGIVSGAKSFSDIESAILESQFSSITDLFSKNWGGDISLHSPYGHLFYGPFVQDRNVTLREAYVVFNIVLFFGKGEQHTLAFAYPNNVVKALIAHYRSQKKPVNPVGILNKKTRQKIKVGARVRLGKGTLTMGQLRSLKKGDVVSLESLITEPLFLTLPNNIQIAAQPGKIDGKLGVQLFNWAAPEDTDDEYSGTDAQVNGKTNGYAVGSAATLGAAALGAAAFQHDRLEQLKESADTESDAHFDEEGEEGIDDPNVDADADTNFEMATDSEPVDDAFDEDSDMDLSPDSSTDENMDSADKNVDESVDEPVDTDRESSENLNEDVGEDLSEDDQKKDSDEPMHEASYDHSDRDDHEHSEYSERSEDSEDHNDHDIQDFHDEDLIDDQDNNDWHDDTDATFQESDDIDLLGKKTTGSPGSENAAQNPPVNPGTPSTPAPTASTDTSADTSSQEDEDDDFSWDDLDDEF